MTSKAIKKTKNMLTLPRLGIYLFAWLLLIIITAMASKKLLIDIDGFVYNKLHTNETNVKFEDKIILIDLPRGNLSLEQYRIETARLLDKINSMVVSQFQSATDSNIKLRKPNVILDLSYGSSEDGIYYLRNAIEELKRNDINVYGAYTLPEDDEKIFFDTFHNEKNKTLYDTVFVGGKLHTNYNRNGCIISYDSFKDVPRDSLGRMIRIESLIVRVAKDNSGILETDFETLKNKAVPIDSLNEKLKPRTYQFAQTFDNESGSFKKFDETLKLNGTFIIVGRFAVDVKDVCGKPVPGPYLLAGGLLNELQPDDDKKVTNEAYADIPVQLGMSLLFGLLASIFFALIFKYLKSLQTKPLLIAFLSFLIGVLLLLGLGFAFLRIGFVIRPALSGVSIFWASFLAWRFAKKFLVTGLIKGSGKYDIFISYSFGNSEWVKKHLYYPLCELKKSDGKKLEIFLAEKNIRFGELFVSKYMNAIVNSKLFIPVMTEEYYQKNHCKNEMDLALNRMIGKFMDICILNFNIKFIPPEFSNILNIDATQENLAKKIMKEVVEKSEDDQKNDLDEGQKEEPKKVKIEKDKKSDKKDKKKDKKKEKEKSKKEAKKEEKKKDKKKSDKKEKDKKSKKGTDKKDKKAEKKKAKKGSEKKAKKVKKGKKKKS